MIRLRTVAACFALPLALGACGSHKPIAHMSCAELHTYYVGHIKPGLDPSASLATKRKATQNAVDLNQRADAIGGCPGSDNW